MRGTTKILERVIAPSRGGMSADLAEQVLSFDFPPEDHARVAELSVKANRGTLTSEEETELEEFLYVNDFLSIIQAKARASLKQRNPAA